MNDNYYDEYEDEIDLIEIWRNFLKNWKLGVLIVVLCTVLGVGGTIAYNKINENKATINTEEIEEDALAVETTTYTITTTSDIQFKFNNEKFSEDGLTNLTAEYFNAYFNTATYKNELVSELKLDNKYNVGMDKITNICWLTQSNGVFTIYTQVDKAWYIKAQGTDVDIENLTNKEVSNKIIKMETEIVKKMTEDVTEALEGQAEYTVLGDPVSRESVESEEEDTKQTTTVETFTPKSVKKYGAIALVLGLVAYCGYVFVKTLLDKTLKTTEDIKRYIDYPVLANIKDDESYKSLAITLTNITNSKTFNIVSPISASDELVNKLNEALNEFGYKCLVKEEIKKASKGTSSYILINSKAINNSSEAIVSSKQADETIIYIPTRRITKQDLEVTKEIVKNNSIKVTGIVIE